MIDSLVPLLRGIDWFLISLIGMEFVFTIVVGTATGIIYENIDPRGFHSTYGGGLLVKELRELDYWYWWYVFCFVTTLGVGIIILATNEALPHDFGTTMLFLAMSPCLVFSMQVVLAPCVTHVPMEIIRFIRG